MKENDPIKNLTEATPEGHPARAPERHPSKETPARMPLDGRIEKRVPRDVHVRLVLNEPLLIAEKAVTVNVSPHGAPLVTRRFWRAEEHPWLASLSPATFASAAAHCGSGEPDSGLETDLWSKRWSAGSWREYLAAGETEAEVTAIRRCTHTGRPLGTAEFVCSLEHATLRRLAPQKGGRPGKVRDHRGQRVLAFEN